MKYLNTDATYEEAIGKVLLQGGDTDTNATIMGMVLGAKYGLKSLDSEQLEKVKEYTCDLGGHARPDFLIPGKGILKNLDYFLSRLPTELQIEYD